MASSYFSRMAASAIIISATAPVSFPSQAFCIDGIVRGTMEEMRMSDPYSSPSALTIVMGKYPSASERYQCTIFDDAPSRSIRSMAARISTKPRSEETPFVEFYGFSKDNHCLLTSFSKEGAAIPIYHGVCSIIQPPSTGGGQ